MEMPVEKKENKTWAIVGTIVAILLCGCPGLTLCVSGIWAATGKMSDVYNGSGYIPNWVGFVLLCMSVFFIAIAVLVPILLLRRKKPETKVAPVDVLPPFPPTTPQDPLPPVPPASPQDPLPPAS